MHLTSHLPSPDDPPSARTLLGAEHPLARVSQQLSVLRRQSLVVGVLLLASVVALVAGRSSALSFVVAAAVVRAALAFGSTLLTQTRHDRVLELIIDGRGNLPLAAVQRERRRLLDRTHREHLAGWLDELRHDAQRPIQTSPTVRPVFSVRVIAAVAPELKQIAALLHGDHANLRGVALLERLLGDGASPLYGQEIERLREELHRIRLLLLSVRPGGMS